ncbi:conserved hypothetical protein [uncultured Paludibacter sp.]|nr:conserved hypothetical protein [uncultured Paludibacter sp.]
MNRIEIYTSKKKSIFLLLGSLLFVVLGIWFVINANNMTDNWRTKFPFITRSVGVISILFFGLGVFQSIKRLIKSELSLIIDQKGLIINPKKSISEYIYWEQISSFNEIQIKRTRIIIINVKNPDYWIERETNLVRKNLMKFNNSTYNSPFNIAASGLDINFDELFNRLNSYLIESIKSK